MLPFHSVRFLWPEPEPERQLEVTFPFTSTISSIVISPAVSTLSRELVAFVLLASVKIPVELQPRIPFVTMLTRCRVPASIFEAGVGHFVKHVIVGKKTLPSLEYT